MPISFTLFRCPIHSLIRFGEFVFQISCTDWSVESGQFSTKLYGLLSWTKRGETKLRKGLALLGKERVTKTGKKKIDHEVTIDTISANYFYILHLECLKQLILAWIIILFLAFKISYSTSNVGMIWHAY